MLKICRCGDLNFRLEQTREVVIREVKDGTSILDFDQVQQPSIYDTCFLSAILCVLLEDMIIASALDFDQV